MQGIFDVKDEGAIGDGVANDAPPIQHAIDRASEKGGIVWLSPGRYRLGAGLVIRNQVILQGVGWNNSGSKGSCLYVDDPSVSPVSIIPGAAGVVIRDLAIVHRHPDPKPGWSPTLYPFAIDVQADDCHLVNLLLFNASRGINIHHPKSAIGRVTLDRIWGQPLLVGIWVDNAQDVIKINNIHFWPFWNGSRDVMDWVAATGTALVSLRNDNPHFSNIFCLGYQTGFRFGASPDGITSKFRISNADCDICGTGIKVDGDRTTGQIANFTTQGQPGSPVGLLVTAKNTTIQAANIRVTGFAGNGVRIENENNRAYIANLWVEGWNTSGNGFPGVEVAAGSNLSISNGCFEDGHGAPTGGGAGNIHWDK